jgi:tRNA pseudouridine38-40 synthase
MSAVQRTKLTVRYDGTGFAGSQIQPARGGWTPRTVSGTLTDELETLLGQRPKLLWASRTDSGVHAEGNVCTLDAQIAMPLAALVERLNSRLMPEIQVRGAEAMPDGWHPRFEARARKYIYRVWRGTDVPYDKLRYVQSVAGGWNAKALAEVARGLPGTWDCAALSRKTGSASTMCTISAFDEVELGPEVQWHITANRFLWRMICNLAGLMLAVADGKVSPAEAKAVLKEGRRAPMKTASARGLVLWEIYYA